MQNHIYIAQGSRVEEARSISISLHKNHNWQCHTWQGGKVIWIHRHLWNPWGPNLEHRTGRSRAGSQPASKHQLCFSLARLTFHRHTHHGPMAAPGLELPSTKEPISSFLTRMEQKEVRCRKGCVFFGESCSLWNHNPHHWFWEGSTQLDHQEKKGESKKQIFLARAGT